MDRQEIYHALIGPSFMQNAEAELYPRTPDDIRRFGLGHVRLLRLMVHDVMKNGARSVSTEVQNQAYTAIANQGFAKGGSVILSDDYRWSASGQLFGWVVNFLRDEATDDDTRRYLGEAFGREQDGLDLRSLSSSGRLDALRVLARVETVIGHIKALRLMAEDVLHRGAA
jgi:hypothetical protein